MFGTNYRPAFAPASAYYLATKPRVHVFGSKFCSALHLSHNGNRQLFKQGCDHHNVSSGRVDPWEVSFRKQRSQLLRHRQLHLSPVGGMGNPQCSDNFTSQSQRLALLLSLHSLVSLNPSRPIITSSFRPIHCHTYVPAKMQYLQLLLIGLATLVLGKQCDHNNCYKAIARYEKETPTFCSKYLAVPYVHFPSLGLPS